jgi:endonuclease YncB( thermonuclease family)
VTHVRDGDTIEVAGKPIRLQGLNCNETGTALGEAATAAMSRLVANGQVTCELSGEMTYDREVGTCYLANGEDLASILILQGVCGRCARYDREGRYLGIEAQAGSFEGVVVTSQSSRRVSAVSGAWARASAPGGAW